MTRSTVRRVVAAATLSTVAVAGLVACGSDDTENASDSSGGTSAAPDASDAADDAAGDGATARAEGDEVPTDEFLELYTAAYAEQTSAQMAMELSGAGTAGVALTAEGAVDYSTTPPQLAMTMEMAGEPLDMRIVDGVLYMGSPEFSDLGAQWLRIDITDPDSAAAIGIDPDQFTQGLDPAAMEELFTAAVRTVTYGGSQDVAGETLERYDVVMDGAAAAETFGLSESEAAAALPETLEYSVWFDGEGLVRQLDMVMPDPATGEDSTITITFDEYGAEVDVAAPPAAETLDFADLLASGGLGAGAAPTP